MNSVHGNAPQILLTMWYNLNCLGEQNTGALLFSKAAVFSQIKFVGKAPLMCGHSSLAVRLDNGSAHKGRFAMTGTKSNTPDWYERVYRPMVHRESGLEHAEWRLLRDSVLRRDNFTCLRCDKKFKYKKMLSVHHIVPRSDGGSNDLSNLVTLCHPCHDYVEYSDLRTRADIMGSIEPVGLTTVGPKSNDDEPDPYGRPEWHKWVYGGGRNPQNDRST